MSEGGGSTNSVFVGNIPYDVTEDQLANLFRQFGEVTKFRLLVDPSNGKGKGYGFCDFATSEAAEAAKKMNNIIAVNGRQLRVDAAAQQVQPTSSGTSSFVSSTTKQSSSAATSKSSRDLDEALKQLNYGEVYDILVEVRAWLKKDPDGVRELLTQKPILAQALLKMQMQMGSLQIPPPADYPFGSFIAPATPSLLAPPQQQQQATGGFQQQIPSIVPSVYGGAPVPNYYQASQYPPITQLYPPPQQQQAQLPGLGSNTSAIEYQDLLRSILQMSEHDVARLNPREQAEVRSIRDKYFNQQGGSSFQ